MKKIFLFVIVFYSILFVTHGNGIDCNCTSTGDYVAPKKLKKPFLNIVSTSEALSPSGIYKIVVTSSGSQAILSMYKVAGQQLLFSESFISDAAWGFSPDDHRFVIWGVNTSGHFVKLYNLENNNPQTPVASIITPGGQGNQSSVSFTPHGKYFVYALIVGVNRTKFEVLNAETGTSKYSTTFDYSVAPGLDGDVYGGATWGSGPDDDDRTMAFAYITTSQQVKWQLLNLSKAAGETVVSNPAPFTVVSSFWMFSPCGDVVARVIQSSANSVQVRFLKTKDGSESGQYDYHVVSLFFRSAVSQHQAKVGTAAYADLTPQYPNNAGQSCSAPPDVTPPSWPGTATLTAELVTDNSVRLEWSAATDGVTTYKIYQDGSEIESLNAPAASLLVGDLQYNRTYAFKVEAGDAAGNYTNNGPSTTIRTANPDTEAPVWPDTTKLHVHASTYNSLYLYWTPANDDREVDEYVIYYNDTPYSTSDKVPNITEYSEIVRNLVAGRTYTFRIEARDAAGNESDTGPSRTLVFNTSSPPVWPQNAAGEASDVSVTSVLLRWARALDNVFVKSYRIYDQYDNYRTINSPGAHLEADTIYLMKDLEPDTEYTFRIFATDEEDNLTTTGIEITFRTLPDTQPPYWPDGSALDYCRLGADYIGVRWPQAFDDVAVKGYRLYQGDQLIKVFQDYYGSNSYTIFDLQPGTEYTFRLEAGDYAENWSVEDLTLTISTLTGPPLTPFLPNTGYEFIPIGEEGYTAVDLNDSGQVVGYNLSGWTQRSFLWDAGTMKDLGSISASRQMCKAYFINNSGQVTGESLSDNGQYHTFFWQNDSIWDIGTLGASWIVATDLNDSGTVVGWARSAPIGSAGFEKAFRYNKNGGIRDLGTLGGERHLNFWERPESKATAINNQDQIAGYTLASVDEQAVRHGFIWKNEVMSDLDATRYINPVSMNDSGIVAGHINNGYYDTDAVVWSAGAVSHIGNLGGGRTFPKGINNQKVVFGYSEVPFITCNGDHAYHAFIWKEGTLTDLGTMGGDNSQVSDVNEKGQAVGWADLPEGRKRACLWQNDVLQSLHPDGFDESKAVAINESGQVLVNAALIETTIDGETGEPRDRYTWYAFLANPVEPPDVIIASTDQVNLCEGASFNVFYEGSFDEDTIMAVQLSDPSGKFDDPLALNFSLIAEGQLLATIPVDLPGDLFDESPVFKIRIIGSKTASVSNLFWLSNVRQDCGGEFSTSISKTSYCAGETMAISIVANGSSFNEDNLFRAWLSDENGSFEDALEIGSLDGAGDRLTAEVPVGLPSGSGYQIRVTASHPEAEAAAHTISIQELPGNTISQDGNVLTAPEGDSYMWISGEDTLDIASRTIIPNESGNYKVVVFQNGCSSVSNIATVAILSVGDQAGGIAFWPNPSDGVVKVDSRAVQDLRIVIHDIQGIKLLDEKFRSIDRLNEIDLSAFPDGMYFITVFSGDICVYRGKIVIKR